MNLYEDVLILSVIYAFIIGLIAREGHIDPVLWCSDRDARTSWGARIFSFYALLNAYDWARQYGQRLDAAQLPSVIFCAEGEEYHLPAHERRAVADRHLGLQAQARRVF